MKGFHISTIDRTLMIIALVLTVFFSPWLVVDCFADEGVYIDPDTGVSYNYDTVTIYDVQGARIKGLADDSAFPDDGVLKLPGQINGLDVISIGPSAFNMNNSLTEVAMPDTVLIIDSYCFSSCGDLKKITLSKKLKTIGMFAFYTCGLMNIDLPDSLESIGMNCFYFCKNLEEVILPEKMTEIPENAFAVCGKLKSIHICAGVTSIMANAFSYCSSFSDITVDPDNTEYKSVDGVLYSKDGKTLVLYPGAREGTEFTVPEGTERIGYYSICSANNLEKIIFPRSLKSIGDFSVQTCNKLKEVTLRNGLQTIGQYAFAYDSALDTIKIPETVTALGEYSFMSTGITSIVIPEGINEIKDATFMSCPALESVYFYNTLSQIDNYAFMGCYKLPEVYIPESVTEIRAMAFEGAGRDVSEGHIFTVKGAAGSYAEQYAANNSFEFVVSKPPEPPRKLDPELNILTGKTVKRVVGSKAFRIKAKAVTPITYRSEDVKIAAVSADGLVTVKRPGKIRIYITAAGDEDYQETTKYLTVTVTPGKPSLKAVNLKGRKVKLTWSKVKYSSGYEVFVKAPGGRKFKKRVTKNAKVKSVFHMGLKKGKKYSYKVRVFSVVNGKTIYGSFSKTRVIKIKK